MTVGINGGAGLDIFAQGLQPSTAGGGGDLLGAMTTPSTGAANDIFTNALSIAGTPTTGSPLADDVFSRSLTGAAPATATNTATTFGGATNAAPQAGDYVPDTRYTIDGS